MLIKDQLKIRMDQLDMQPNELARRVGVSGQSVRYWLEGRNFPTKAKTGLLEQALGCRLDFSEGESVQSVTVDEALRKADIDTFVVMSKLPPDIQAMFTTMAQRYLDLQAGEPAIARSAAEVASLPMPAATLAPAPVKISPRRVSHA